MPAAMGLDFMVEAIFTAFRGTVRLREGALVLIAGCSVRSNCLLDINCFLVLAYQ